MEAGETLSFTVQIPKDAAYTLGLLYCPGDDKRRPVEAAITVDGLYPFEDMEKLTFPKLWENAGEPRVDGQGNEFAPEQILVKAYTQQVAVDYRPSGAPVHDRLDGWRTCDYGKSFGRAFCTGSLDPGSAGGCLAV